MWSPVIFTQVPRYSAPMVCIYALKKMTPPPHVSCFNASTPRHLLLPHNRFGLSLHTRARSLASPSQGMASMAWHGLVWRSFWLSPLLSNFSQ